MRPLDLRTVNWQPGMLIRHEHFEALDSHTRARTAWILRHAARFGVVRPIGDTLPPVELESRIEHDRLVVRVRRCIGITPGGSLIDIQPDSDLDARLLPSGTLDIDLSAEGIQVPVIIEVMGADAALRIGEAEADGRQPYRVPRYRVLLDEAGLGEPAWALQVAELIVNRGHIEESKGFIPPACWIEDVPALHEAFRAIEVRFDRIRDLLVQHLTAYSAGLRTDRVDYANKRGIVADLLNRLSLLELVRSTHRVRTPPEEAFAACAGVLDGFRTAIDANHVLREAIRSHYVERQPASHQGAAEFFEKLRAVRTWHFSPWTMMRVLQPCADLLEQLLIAFDEPIREMMGPSERHIVLDEDAVHYKGKAYVKLPDLALQIQKDYLEICGLPQQVIGQLLVKFPRIGLPPDLGFGVQFAVDEFTLLDFRDGLVDQASDPGYCILLLQISQEARRRIRITFDPRDPLELLRSIKEDYNRRWWIGWV